MDAEGICDSAISYQRDAKGRLGGSDYVGGFLFFQTMEVQGF